MHVVLQRQPVQHHLVPATNHEGQQVEQVAVEAHQVQIDDPVMVQCPLNNSPTIAATNQQCGPQPAARSPEPQDPPQISNTTRPNCTQEATTATNVLTLPLELYLQQHKSTRVKVLFAKLQKTRAVLDDLVAVCQVQSCLSLSCRHRKRVTALHCACVMC